MELQLIVVSFVAGVLTILAPCIFPILPVLLGSSASNNDDKKHNPFTVVIALLASVMILTLLIYGTSNVLNIQQGVLRAISASIIVIVGLFMLLPNLWENQQIAKLAVSGNKLLGKGATKGGLKGDILIGTSLGPVFSSCSPTYGIIIATILPQNFATGTLYLLWYLLGLGVVLLLITYFGRRFVSKLSWATNPNGWFKRVIAVVFIVVGVSIFLNWDKNFEAWLLHFNVYDNLVNFELNLTN